LSKYSELIAITSQALSNWDAGQPGLEAGGIPAEDRASLAFHLLISLFSPHAAAKTVELPRVTLTWKTHIGNQ